MTTWLRHPIYAGLLALAWIALQRHLSIGNLLIGYTLGLLIVHLTRHFWAERVWVRRPATLMRLALRFAREVVVANFQVAWIVLRPQLDVKPAFILLPLQLQDDLMITALANMITLTPGTLTVDVAADRSALYVHCLSAPDVAAVRAKITREFEAPLAESIACSPLPQP